MEPKNRLNEDAQQVNNTIARVRRRGGRLKDEYVTLAHGAGGKASASLLQHVFFDEYGNDLLGQGGDSTVLDLALSQQQHPGAKLAFSTDSYVVNPIEFPGGSIGELAIHGTVNDLAVAGAVPQFISVAFILEEGLPIETLRRLVQQMKQAAETSGVTIATGDTKVVPKGKGDQVYITTAGVGLIPEGRELGFSQVQVGDRILVSGPIADHGMSVMMARGDLAIDAPIESDTREVASLTHALLQAVPNTRWMRDATRGGVATVMNELAETTGLGVVLEDEAIPVRPMTRAACDMLGIDPLYVANEGTFLAVVPQERADAAQAAVQQAGAPEARLIGSIVEKPEACVVLVTAFGGTRMVDKLVGDPLPRIC
ncbi:hydrogenase expression/formation protein HypE [Corynebacterium sp. 153RC1]|uniref:hydrogenase expression/formation protein HypE n=1 Tax=unclassified Corynebacterium TaxID=2624378 RepID=UPI00211CAEE7|nr:hydrogenase expression/formation protein HypE [Corynebacterium sp. 209RC1]MCQ9354821.1 hydrogenase expression/formation protein HypE [Corynebacterium sp. 1222RC1]MCQ9357006.1 hydrogenase expression/formation protein HypE [Corynebacterium sp. 122RC1]MCQ9359089.1 hydrogenase expression/formation protein HypE [Corynebacterium sp. 142RC1]MCQ9361474.1 hydrogenase expression/formation protein HypE [Corynebacterium sp. 153RC1]MCQ9363599.1 hydrogenase expression/formation protein HypE [Corynebacter